MSAAVPADNNNNNNGNICANCGKGEENGKSLKACTACKLVKYCNRECQIAHRSQHKKECKKRAAKLHEEKLFKKPPSQYVDCPICFLRMPELDTGKRYQTCCGKYICSGCIYANAHIDLKKQLCPFCRIPHPKTDEEAINRVKKRAEAGDDMAIHNRGCDYANGDSGLSQDYAKALELWHQAGELGSARSYYNIGHSYVIGAGVERDKQKTKHYWELAAIGGYVKARGNLGSLEARAGNFDRALRHYMIAVRSGCNDSMNLVRLMYSNRDATKDDYTKALREYQAYLDEIRSDQREKAAAANDKYKYIE